MNHTSLHRAAPSMQPSSSLSRDVTEELRRYDEHLSDVRGLAEGTRHRLALIIGRLLRRKFADRPINIAKLRPEDIRRFLADQQGVNRSPSNASQLASALRSYFRYRTTCGDQVGGLTAVISNPVHWKLASLPRALRPDEADRLLKSFATARRWPKRGYAIVRCALDLGLRAGEIARLMISDIDWQVGTVTRDEMLAVIGTPDGTWISQRDHVLFLMLYNAGARVSEIIAVKVGDVVLDAGAACVHLHGKGRKQRSVPLWRSTVKAVRAWLRLNPQFEAASALLPNRNGQAMTRTNVALRLALAVQSATGAFPGLAKRRVSPHIIRHTTAMHLLQAGVDISVIALWLGHESPATTHHYVEADLTMKERALAKLHEPTAKIQRYRAPDSLINFLKSL